MQSICPFLLFLLVFWAAPFSRKRFVVQSMKCVKGTDFDGHALYTPDGCGSSICSAKTSSGAHVNGLNCTIGNYGQHSPGACKRIKDDLLSSSQRGVLDFEGVCQARLTAISLYQFTCDQVPNVSEASLNFTFHLPTCGKRFSEELDSVMVDFSAEKEFYHSNPICRVFFYGRNNFYIVSKEESVHVSYDCMAIGLEHKYPQVYYYLSLTAYPSAAQLNYTIVYLKVSKGSLQLIAAVWRSTRRIHVVFLPIPGIRRYQVEASGDQYSSVQKVSSPEVEIKDIPSQANVVTVKVSVLERDRGQCDTLSMNCSPISVTLQDKTQINLPTERPSPSPDKRPAVAWTNVVLLVLVGVIAICLIIVTAVAIYKRYFATPASQLPRFASLTLHEAPKVLILTGFPRDAGCMAILPTNNIRVTDAFNEHGPFRAGSPDTSRKCLSLSHDHDLLVIIISSSILQSELWPDMQTWIKFIFEMNMVHMTRVVSLQDQNGRAVKASDIFLETLTGMNADLVREFLEALDNCTFVLPQDQDRLVNDLMAPRQAVLPPASEQSVSEISVDFGENGHCGDVEVQVHNHVDGEGINLPLSPNDRQDFNQSLDNPGMSRTRVQTSLVEHESDTYVKVPLSGPITSSSLPQSQSMAHRPQDETRFNHQLATHSNLSSLPQMPHEHATNSLRWSFPSLFTVDEGPGPPHRREEQAPLLSDVDHGLPCEDSEPRLPSDPEECFAEVSGADFRAGHQSSPGTAGPGQEFYQHQSPDQYSDRMSTSLDHNSTTALQLLKQPGETSLSSLQHQSCSQLLWQYQQRQASEQSWQHAAREVSDDAREGEQNSYHSNQVHCTAACAKGQPVCQTLSSSPSHCRASSQASHGASGMLSPTVTAAPRHASASQHPSMASRHPSMASHQPPMASRQSSTTSQQPSTTSQQPSTTFQQPTTTSQQPSMTSPQPLQSTMASQQTSVSCHIPSNSRMQTRTPGHASSVHSPSMIPQLTSQPSLTSFGQSNNHRHTGTPGMGHTGCKASQPDHQQRGNNHRHTVAPGMGHTGCKASQPEHQPTSLTPAQTSPACQQQDNNHRLTVAPGQNRADSSCEPFCGTVPATVKCSHPLLSQHIHDDRYLRARTARNGENCGRCRHPRPIGNDPIIVTESPHNQDLMEIVEEVFGSLMINGVHTSAGSEQALEGGCLQSEDGQFSRGIRNSVEGTDLQNGNGQFSQALGNNDEGTHLLSEDGRFYQAIGNNDEGTDLLGEDGRFSQAIGNRDAGTDLQNENYQFSRGIEKTDLHSETCWFSRANGDSEEGTDLQSEHCQFYQGVGNIDEGTDLQSENYRFSQAIGSNVERRGTAQENLRSRQAVDQAGMVLARDWRNVTHDAELRQTETAHHYLNTAAESRWRKTHEHDENLHAELRRTVYNQDVKTPVDLRQTGNNHIVNSLADPRQMVYSHHVNSPAEPRQRPTRQVDENFHTKPKQTVAQHELDTERNTTERHFHYQPSGGRQPVENDDDDDDDDDNG